MDSDRAYKQALDQARKEAARYLDQFTGLKERLSIEWERDANGGTDGNRKTIQCNQRMEKTIIMSIPFLSRMVNM